MSSPKTYRELVLYALAKVVDARASITYVGDSVDTYAMFGRYYSAVKALINAASPKLGNPEELIGRCLRAWDLIEKDEEYRSVRIGKAVAALDSVVRDVVKELTRWFNE